MATKKSLSTVTRFYKTLSFEQPSAAVMEALALRLDNGSATFGEVLKTLYLSATVASHSPADDVARMFFLALDRAPDAPLYDAAMNALRSGSTLAEIASYLLSAPGFALSNAGLPSNAAFASALVLRAVGVNPSLTNTVESLLNTGAMGRADLLVAVAAIADTLAAPQNKVETALLYLAAAGREATAVELAFMSGSTDEKIIASLSAGGLSATGNGMAFFREGNTLKIYGELVGDLVWRPGSDSYTLGGKTAFKVFLSTDGGLSGSMVDFSKAMASGVTNIDASNAVGKGKLLITADPLVPIVFKAPASGATMIGSDGSDILYGGSGADVFYLTASADTVTGGLGDDRFILSASTVYQNSSNQGATITDFGNGKDVLDFSRLLNKTVDITRLDAFLAVGEVLPVPALLNGGVVVIENNGAWTTGTGATLVSRRADSTDVEALFGAGALLGKPTKVMKSVVITADTRSSADVWLILNNTDVGQITSGDALNPQEIFHIAHLVGSWNTSLGDNFPVVLPPDITL
ncbi:MAG: hypothetical protein KA295_03685 [Giesbergeria sp.]|nr:hypothetical protein [Giesbergeria sp.]MBP6375424.1 hypothetical protein [Giesbergeria sp.]